jgi:hypothetical protein
MQTTPARTSLRTTHGMISHPMIRSPIPSPFNDEAYVTTSRPQRKYAHTWPILQRMHAPERRHDRCVGSHSPYRPSTNQARRLHHPLPLAASLPDNYHPTAVQKAVKHHPVFDLLPWPSVRSKILHILTVAHGSQTLNVQRPTCRV